MKLLVCRLGRTEYAKALSVQERLQDLRQRQLIDNILLLVEHPPVLTLGVRGDRANILLPEAELSALGVTIHKVNRGGDVTYHGPGQIVGYPILDLNDFGRDIKRFVWNVEEVFIRLLREQFNITADREEKRYTGVWVGDSKITAIGIAVQRWVTMHGFAFNVNTNLEHFRWINPCGITDRGVTSLEKLMGHPLDFDRMNDMVAEYFTDAFSLKLQPVEYSELLRSVDMREEETCPSPIG